jgi:hypothetical protein
MATPSRIQTLPPDYTPKVARPVGCMHQFSVEEQPLVEITHKWYPKLASNPNQYGEIVSMGVGHGHIVIYVAHKNELTANIPSHLDGVPIELIETGVVSSRQCNLHLRGVLRITPRLHYYIKSEQRSDFMV